jgi:hypothetical protein
VVRFFRPEQKEEWKVLIDARRARVAAFVNPIAEDAPAAAPPTAEAASRRALDAARKLGYPADEYTVLEVGTEKRPKRVDTTVVLEAKKGVGEARPRLTAVFHGPRLAFFLPTIRVPESFLREYRKTSSTDSFRLVIRIVAGGALLAVAVIVFVRLVRARGIRFKEEAKPLLWTAAIAAAGMANGIPAIFRRYPTDTPLILFRLTVAVSLGLSFSFLLLMAFVGYSLISGARPGWTAALRRKGTLGDAFLRAAIAAAGAAGLARWARVIFSRVPSLYEPDPSLPGSLETKFPSIDVLWSTGRGIFFLAALAAVAALALRGRFFQTTLGRLAGAAAVLVALLPSDSIPSPSSSPMPSRPSSARCGWPRPPPCSSATMPRPGSSLASSHSVCGTRRTSRPSRRRGPGLRRSRGPAPGRRRGGPAGGETGPECPP